MTKSKLSGLKPGMYVEHTGTGPYAGSKGVVMETKMKPRKVWGPRRVGKYGRPLKRTQVYKLFPEVLVGWQYLADGTLYLRLKWMSPANLKFIGIPSDRDDLKLIS